MIQEIINWIAFFVTMIGFWYVRKKNKKGMLVYLAADAFWITTYILYGMLPGLIMTLIYVPIEINTYLKWKKEEK